MPPFFNMGNVSKVVFYGDAKPSLKMPVLCIMENNTLVVCDFTEAGAHVGGKLSQKYEHWEMELKTLLSLLDPDTPVYGYGVDYWASFFKENDVKTVGELLNILSSQRR